MLTGIRHRRGFTIVELLSYMFLSSLLLTVMILFLKGVLGRYAYVSGKVSVRKVASLIVHQFEDDLNSSTLDAVSLSTVPDQTVAVQPAASVTGEGHFLWSSSYICYRHRQENHTLRRWTEVRSDMTPSSLERLEEGELRQLAPVNERSWGFVQDFSVEARPGSSLFVLEFSLKLKDSRGHEHSHSVKRNLYCGNGVEP